jgi:tripartite-type tricarboxylate transporter receptor subunit TctC
METAMITRRILLSWMAAVGCLAAPGMALAQSYPSKPIKLIVPLPPAGTIDVIARLVAQHLSARLGQNLIVENRVGAGGIIAAKAVASAEPDGYTLLFGTSGSLAITPALYRSSEAANLVPVAVTAVNPPLLLTIGSAVPARTAAELIALARGNPGKLAHGSALGSPPHLLVEFFRAKTGIDIRHIPYRGSAQAMPDLLAGQIQIIPESVPILAPFIQEGKLRPLVATGEARASEFPDVPTLTEIGLEGFPSDTWTGLLAPRGTPAQIVDKLNAAVRAAARSPEMIASLSKLGFHAEPGSASDFSAIVATDTGKWAEVVKLTGVTVE